MVGKGYHAFVGTIQISCTNNSSRDWNNGILHGIQYEKEAYYNTDYRWSKFMYNLMLLSIYTFGISMGLAIVGEFEKMIIKIKRGQGSKR